jgi:hypothetical protein
MRIVSLFLCAVLAFSFAGCGDSGISEGVPKDAGNQPPPPIPGVDLSKGSIVKETKKKGGSDIP